MQINNHPNQVSFREKYPIERLLSCACNTPFIRKSDSVNLITSINKLRKNEKREMLRDENVFNHYLKKTGEYILAEFPSLNYFVKQLNTSSEKYKDYIISCTKINLGEEIDIKHIIRHQKPKIEQHKKLKTSA